MAMQQRRQINEQESHLRALPSQEMYQATKIKKALQATANFSPEQIEQLILTVPAQFQEMAIRLVAQQFVHSMTLHMLQLATTFHQHAEAEGIHVDERDETMQDAKIELDSLIDLTRKLTVNTLETLLRLAEITVSIQDLSQCRGAEEIQSWLHDLPAIYQESLEREKLVQA